MENFRYFSERFACITTTIVFYFYALHFIRRMAKGISSGGKSWKGMEIPSPIEFRQMNEIGSFILQRGAVNLPFVGGNEFSMEIFLDAAKFGGGIFVVALYCTVHPSGHT